MVAFIEARTASRISATSKSGDHVTEATVVPSMDDTRIIQKLFAQLVMPFRHLVKHDTTQTSTNLLLHASGFD